MRPVPHARISTEQQRRWQEENKDAVASINAFVERHGLLASKLRYRPDRDDTGVRS